MSQNSPLKQKVPNEIRFYRASGEYGYLSNLYRIPITFEGKEFRSAEDAYQFGKPKDLEIAEWLISAPKPHLCAAAAHALFAFDIRPDWSTYKVVRMAKVIDTKFGQNPVIACKLIDTWPAYLTEESNTDAYWGIGKKGNGQNMLGILLMATRNELRRKIGLEVGDP